MYRATSGIINAEARSASFLEQNPVERARSRANSSREAATGRVEGEFFSIPLVSVKSSPSPSQSRSSSFINGRVSVALRKIAPVSRDAFEVTDVI